LSHPPFKRHKLALALLLLLGVSAGTGTFTFHYGEGLSYFSADPKACVNCHIMKPQFDSWQKASHQNAAACVDCHLPTSFIAKYIAKADNGWRHSKAFTLQDFKEPIAITPRNQEILQANCLRCHQQLTHPLAGARKDGLKSLRCVHCHQDAGHGEPVGMGRIYDELKGLDQ
jgi:cytochrome c nitrite reductase small subunit